MPGRPGRRQPCRDFRETGLRAGLPAGSSAGFRPWLSGAATRHRRIGGRSPCVDAAGMGACSASRLARRFAPIGGRGFCPRHRGAGWRTRPGLAGRRPADDDRQGLFLLSGSFSRGRESTRRRRRRSSPVPGRPAQPGAAIPGVPLAPRRRLVRTALPRWSSSHWSSPRWSISRWSSPTALPRWSVSRWFVSAGWRRRRYRAGRPHAGWASRWFVSAGRRRRARGRAAPEPSRGSAQVVLAADGVAVGCAGRVLGSVRGTIAHFGSHSRSSAGIAW